jgi:WD40 repeat protein
LTSRYIKINKAISNNLKYFLCFPDDIVSGSRDGKVYVWNARTGETVVGPFDGHTDWINSVVFSPDGQRIVSGSGDRTIRVWNAVTGETAAGPFAGHTDWVNSVAFSPDGQHIVSGSNDRTVRVWDAMTGETAAGPFTGHSDWVRSVAFSPDGQHIASGSFDRTIRVSNVAIGKPETANDVRFTDHFMINDEGWICGSKGELLMWIPSVYREYLHRPSTIWISGKRGTILNLSNFMHGRSWATCIDA